MLTNMGSNQIKQLALVPGGGLELEAFRRRDTERMRGGEPSAEIPNVVRDLWGARAVNLRWCREGDLNPHSPFGPADFKSQHGIN